MFNYERLNFPSLYVKRFIGDANFIHMCIVNSPSYNFNKQFYIHSSFVILFLIHILIHV